MSSIKMSLEVSHRELLSLFGEVGRAGSHATDFCALPLCHQNTALATEDELYKLSLVREPRQVAATPPEVGAQSERKKLKNMLRASRKMFVVGQERPKRFFAMRCPR